MSKIRVSGLSMTPVLLPGDELIVRWCHGPFAVGDIVVYRDRVTGEWIVHRVVARHFNQYTIKGDASQTSEQVAAAEIWGIVTGVAGKRSVAIHRLAYPIAVFSRLSLRKPVAILGLFARVRVETRSLQAGTFIENTATKVALREFELEEVLSLFASAKIRTILLKGIDLAFRAYPSPLERPMGDIDLLVQLSDYNRAKELLAGINYPQTEKVYSHSFRGAHSRSGRVVSIDLHERGLDSQTKDELAGWWSRAERSQRHESFDNAFVLEPTDLLLYVIAHAGVQHLFEDDFWFRDVAQILKTLPIDWPRFLDQAINKKMRVASLIMLEIAASEYGAVIPDFVIEALGNGFGNRRRRQILLLSESRYWTDRPSRGFYWLILHRAFVRDDLRAVAEYGYSRYSRLFRERILERKRASAPHPIVGISEEQSSSARENQT